MRKYSITDKSNKLNQTHIERSAVRNISLDSKSMLRFIALLALASLLILISNIWKIGLTTLISNYVISNYVLALLGGSIALWLDHLKYDSNWQNTFAISNILTNLQVNLWFAVNCCLTQFYDLETSTLVVALVLLIKNSLSDGQFSKKNISWVILLGISSLILTGILNNLSAQFTLLIGIAIPVYSLLLILQKFAGSFYSFTFLNPTAKTSKVQMNFSNLERFMLNIPIGIVQWNNERQFVSINPKAADIFQPAVKCECLLGSCVDQLINNQDIVIIPQSEFDQMLGQDIALIRTKQETMDNAKVICKWLETVRFDSKGNICGGMACLENITEQIKTILKIKNHAYYDLVTGLPNRYRLIDEMTRVLSVVQRTKSYCAILFIDLDRFKEVNDQWGHNHGDAVLESFAHRLRTIIRSQETVARLGGDEFVAVIEELGTCKAKAKNHVAQVASKILCMANNDFIIDNKLSRIGCSIGITLFNDPSLNSKDLLKRADHALYRIKRNGRCNFIFDEAITLPSSETSPGKLQFQY